MDNPKFREIERLSNDELLSCAIDMLRAVAVGTPSGPFLSAHDVEMLIQHSGRPSSLRDPRMNVLSLCYVMLGMADVVIWPNELAKIWPDEQSGPNMVTGLCDDLIAEKTD